MISIALPIIVIGIVLLVILMSHFRRKRWIYVLCAFIYVFFVFMIVSSFFYTDEKKLIGGFVYNSERKDISGRFDIPPTIINYEMKDDYIFIKQVPESPIHAYYNIQYYDYRQDKGTLFWIIDIREQSPIGPLDSVSFYQYKDSILFSKVKHR